MKSKTPKCLRNPMNTRSNKQLLLGHAILHAWWRKPSRTCWTRTEVRDEHTRLVAVMKERGFKHKSPLR